ncbi:DAD1 [Symbiodinium sp. KB8]|nr:DAD1 [Symbiodinium sp. KB8]
MDVYLKNAKQGWAEYLKTTPAQVRLLDAFLLFALTTAAVLVVYMSLVGTFPFNSFLSALAACAGVFVLTVGLRMQVTDPGKFGGRSQQAAFADYVLCNIVLFLVTLNFIG